MAKKVEKQVEKNGDLVGLISAAKNYDRVSRNYHALQPSQRYVEEHNYANCKDRLHFMINGIIDARVWALLAPAIKKGMSQFLDKDFNDIIEDKVAKLMKKLAPIKEKPAEEK